MTNSNDQQQRFWQARFWTCFWCFGVCLRGQCGQCWVRFQSPPCFSNEFHGNVDRALFAETTLTSGDFPEVSKAGGVNRGTPTPPPRREPPTLASWPAAKTACVAGCGCLGVGRSWIAAKACKKQEPLELLTDMAVQTYGGQESGGESANSAPGR